MVAFRITVNGRTYFESEDLSVLTMVAEQIRRRSGYRISLHAGAGDAPVQWLAADLKLGDQIVSRVVDATETDQEPLTCSFCRREAHEVASLICGPSSAICDTCIRGFSTAVKNAAQLAGGASIRVEAEWNWGFCGNRPADAGGVVVRNGAAVCPACLRVCFDILSE